MRKLTIGLALGALFALVSAGNAFAAEAPANYITGGTGSPENGTTKEPKAFSGSWSLVGQSTFPNGRPPAPNYWEWAWEGVVAHDAGIPTCTSAQINNAVSESVCPPGSLVGKGPNLVAALGPTGDPSPGVTSPCTGKTIDVYNAGPGKATFAIDGPPAECLTLGFLGAFDVSVTTSGGKSVFRWVQPDNLTHPLPGVTGTLVSGTMGFQAVAASSKAASVAKKKKKKKKKVKHYYLESTGCVPPTRDFTYTVSDEFGTHTNTTSAGPCNKAKKAKKKKKKK